MQEHMHAKNHSKTSKQPSNGATTLTAELLEAVLSAPEKLKYEAIQLLRGQISFEPHPVDCKTHEPYLSLREVAQRVGFSACTLWRYGIPGHELGGRRRFRLSEVHAYLKSEEFKRRAAALRAERKSAAKPAIKEQAKGGPR